MFKIEGGGGPSYLKRTTDSEFPRTFDVIPYGGPNIVLGTRIGILSLIINRFSIQNHCWKAQKLSFTL